MQLADAGYRSEVLGVENLKKVLLAVIFQTIPTLSFSFLNRGLIRVGLKWVRDFCNPKFTGESIYLQVFLSKFLRFNSIVGFQNEGNANMVVLPHLVAKCYLENIETFIKINGKYTISVEPGFQQVPPGSSYPTLPPN